MSINKKKKAVLLLVIIYSSTIIISFYRGKRNQLRLFQENDYSNYGYGESYAIVSGLTNNIEWINDKSLYISQLDSKIQVFADKRYNDKSNVDSLYFYVNTLNHQIWGDDDWLTNQEKEIVNDLAKESGIIGSFKESDFIIDYEKILNFNTALYEYPDRLFHEEVQGNIGYYHTFEERIEKRNYINSNSK